MVKIIPHARLKKNQDTYYIPDSTGGIYFRNHTHSFRMQGSTVYQWMEKLIPMFDGTHTMQDITDGLPDTYKKRVYELANILLQEGFVRDVSNDQAHTLSEDIMKKYPSQIDYLDHHAGSGAYRFEKYRQSNLLVIGSAALLPFLLSSLIESGLQTIHFFIIDQKDTPMENIQKIEAEARKTDPAVQIVPITPESVHPWRKIIRPYDAVLFAGNETDEEKIKEIATLCGNEKKFFLAAIAGKDTGMIGSMLDWESARTRVPRKTDRETAEPNHTALAVLTNVLALRWFQLITEVISPERTQIFLLDMQTLEGKWHSVSHPLAHKSENMLESLDFSKWFAVAPQQTTNILHIFAKITSSKTGIFRNWGPDDLLQLPLSQCQVEISDPLAEKKLPPIICSGLTHLEAQREAGLSGLEAYTSRYLKDASHLGIGVGENYTEAISRGLQKYLAAKIGKQPTLLQPITSQQIEDNQSRYFAKCLTISGANPAIYTGEHIYYFPTVWIKANDRWFGSIGFDLNMAIRTALQKTLQSFQNQSTVDLIIEDIPTSTRADSFANTLASTMSHLKQQNHKLKVFNITLENTIPQQLSVVGVTIEEGE